MVGAFPIFGAFAAGGSVILVVGTLKLLRPAPRIVVFRPRIGLLDGIRAMSFRSPCPGDTRPSPVRSRALGGQLAQAHEDGILGLLLEVLLDGVVGRLDVTLAGPAAVKVG